MQNCCVPNWPGTMSSIPNMLMLNLSATIIGRIFLNKCIYCNCDTADSAFVKYFAKLKSQGLIKDVWFSGGLGGTDFRSPQAIELLQRADVVVTNPPFSLFRDFMDLLIEYQKPFLVIGNKNAIAQRTMLVRATSPNVPICGRPEGPYPVSNNT